MSFPRVSPSPLRVVGLAGLALGLAPPVSAAAAQARPGVEVANFDSLETIPNTFSPRSGPPGTVVTLHVGDLPIAAPLRVGVGSRYGFEEVGWVMSDDSGAFTFDLVIPASASLDVASFLIVFDPYFRPIGLTDPFHVTGPDGTLRRNGRITGVDGPCPLLRAADGMRYALVGALGDVTEEREVSVRGTLTDPCDGHPTIAVSHVTSQDRRREPAVRRVSGPASTRSRPRSRSAPTGSATPGSSPPR